MRQSVAVRSTLASAVWPVMENRSALLRRAVALLRLAVLVLAGTAILAASAQVKVPMWPVPVTMQTFVVLMIGMAYGWRLGGATLLAYMGEGALGLPVFASGGGLAYFAGPTSGFLIGFFVAAVFVGWLAERGWDQSLLRTAIAMTGGTALIYLFGVSWLAVFFGDVDKALVHGLYPFIVGDMVKIALAALLLPFCWKLLDRFSR
jgi:biotin transport system substrate-specific component